MENVLDAGGRFFVDEKNLNLKLFSISYILRSTAWTMPILSLYWVNESSIVMGTYLVLAAIIPVLSLILDFPLSLLADKISLKKSYMIGLIFSSLAFIFPVFWEGVTGYIFYLIFGAIANGFLSGLEVAFLRDLCGQENYRTKFSQITKRFYLYTIPCLFAGVFLFNHSPKLLLLIQGGCILLSVLLVSKISYKVPTIQRKRGTETVVESWEVKVNFKYLTLVALILLMMTLLNGIVQFQNRTIQILIDQNIDNTNQNYYYIIAGLFAIGNILTSLGVSRGITTFLKGKKSWVISLLLVFVFCSSLILMSTREIGLIIIGYIFISLGKGIYRPFFQAIFSILQPVGSWKAKWFSIASVVSGVLIALINTVTVKYTDDIAYIQLIWGAMLFIVGSITITVLYKMQLLRLELRSHPGFSNTIKYRLLDIAAGDEVYFEKVEHSIVREEIDINYFREKIKNSHLKAPKIISIDHGKIFKWEFIDGRVLEELAVFQVEKIVKELFLDLQGREILNLGKEDVEYINGLMNRRALHFCNCMCSSHNDLHPGNIMIDTSNQYKVIDWEFSGINCKVVDEFSIFWNPFLNIRLNDRLEMTEKLFNLHNAKCKVHTYYFQDIIKELLIAKLKDIESWNVKNDYMIKLKNGYQDLLSQLEKMD